MNNLLQNILAWDSRLTSWPFMTLSIKNENSDHTYHTGSAWSMDKMAAFSWIKHLVTMGNCYVISALHTWRTTTSAKNGCSYLPPEHNVCYLADDICICIWGGGGGGGCSGWVDGWMGGGGGGGGALKTKGKWPSCLTCCPPRHEILNNICTRVANCCAHEMVILPFIHTGVSAKTVRN